MSVFTFTNTTKGGFTQTSHQAFPSPQTVFAEDEKALMDCLLTDAELIAEAIAINHRQASDKTIAKYLKHLEHYSAYLSSAFGLSICTAKRKHVIQFMNHLVVKGDSIQRAACQWCSLHGFPDSQKDGGWSPSTRKSYLSAVRFVYAHCLEEDDLPDVDPSARLNSPKCNSELGYTPTKEEVKKILEADGKPRDTLLAYWLYFAPSRRQTYCDARWKHIDLETGVWRIPHAKGNKVDEFALHPLLRARLKKYRVWQFQEAKTNDYIRYALEDDDSAYVLLSSKGKPLAPSSVAKLITWRAIRAGVGLVDVAADRKDCPSGKTSKVTPHALRRAWATHALNDETNPVPIDVVSEVLNHADISTTRRHYAPTKPERAKDALIRMKL